MSTLPKKRITLATVKKFIRENEGKIYIKIRLSFDTMRDCQESVEDDFTLAEKPEDARYSEPRYDLGIPGAWFSSGKRGNHFSKYEDDKFIGIDVYNSIRNFYIVIKKEA